MPACVRAQGYVHVCCLGDVGGCIFLIMPVDVRRCCRLLMFICLPLFETPSL